VTVLLVFLGGAVGAPTRYLVDRFIQARHVQRFPFGTLTVNLAGCLILGLITGRVAAGAWSAHTQALLGTGFCGGLTTFSTFSVETVDLLGQRLSYRAAAYVLASTALGLAAARSGWALGR